MTTFVGSGSLGNVNGVGTAASFHYINGFGLSPDESYVLIADMLSQNIRKAIVSTGAVTHFCGSSLAGYVEGPCATARFYNIYGIEISPDGAYALAADRISQRLRKLTISTMQVSTLVGSGTPGSADGVGTAAQLCYLSGSKISHDGTFALIANRGGHNVKKVIISTGVVTTLAGSKAQTPGATDGTGQAARFDNPTKVAFSPDDSFALVPEFGNHKVRKIIISTGVVTTFAGSGATPGHADGVGTNAILHKAIGVDISSDGSFAVISCDASVRKIIISTGVVTTVAGGATAGFADGAGASAKMENVWDLALTSDDMWAFLADSANARIRKVSSKRHMPPEHNSHSHLPFCTPTSFFTHL
jgi:hypothetical protein